MVKNVTVLYMKHKQIRNLSRNKQFQSFAGQNTWMDRSHNKYFELQSVTTISRKSPVQLCPTLGSKMFQIVVKVDWNFLRNNFCAFFRHHVTQLEQKRFFEAFSIFSRLNISFSLSSAPPPKKKSLDLKNESFFASVKWTLSFNSADLNLVNDSLLRVLRLKGATLEPYLGFWSSNSISSST